MPTEANQVFMFPPPCLVPVAEALPHLGGLRLVPFVGDVPDETEPFEPDVLEHDFDDRIATQMLERTLNTDVVRKRLGGTRWAAIGVSQYGERTKDEPRWYLAVAYDYLRNVAVEIRIDENGEVTDVADAVYQPPASEAELSRAVELARSDGRLADADLDQLTVHTMLLDADVSNGVAVDAHVRIVEVLFACRHERLPRYRAWVDLSTDRVVRAGRAEGCCNCEEKENER